MMRGSKPMERSVGPQRTLLCQVVGLGLAYGSEAGGGWVIWRATAVGEGKAKVRWNRWESRKSIRSMDNIMYADMYRDGL